MASRIFLELQRKKVLTLGLTLPVRQSILKVLRSCRTTYAVNALIRIGGDKKTNDANLTGQIQFQEKIQKVLLTKILIPADTLNVKALEFRTLSGK